MGLPDVVARHLFPLCSLILTGIVNAVYLRWPVLEDLGVPAVAVLGLLNGLLVAVALYLNPNLRDREPWLVPPAPK